MRGAVLWCSGAGGGGSGLQTVMGAEGKGLPLQQSCLLPERVRPQPSA